MRPVDAYSRWELHKLAVLGVRRACVGGLLGFPPVFVADVVLRRAGLATDSILAAATRIVVLCAVVASVYAYVRIRGDDAKLPFMLGSLLMLMVAFFTGLAAAPTGGLTSPYAFGLVPVLLTWALLMPGGAKWAAVPLLGGFAIYTAVLLIQLRGHFVVATALSVTLFQFIGTVAGLVCAEVVESWRRKLAVASTTDSLTALMSRSYVLERLSELCALRAREPADFSVVMVDIDHFKRINDTYGHATGDVVLRTVANLSRSVVRNTDLVGRFGGEEFVLLLDHCSRDEARAVAERLRDRVESTPIVVGGRRISVTLSAGVAGAVANSRDTPEALLHAADEALYGSKDGGRNRTSVADDPRTAAS